LDICVGAPEFLVTPLLTGLVCLLSKGRFEEPWGWGNGSSVTVEVGFQVCEDEWGWG